LQKPLIPRNQPFIDPPPARLAALRFLVLRASPRRAVSSAVEHYVDIVGVTGSIPVPPTTGFTAPHLGVNSNWRKDAPRLKEKAMKVKNSLRSLKQRHRDCRVVRRKGRVYVINKTQPRFKARQG
tara:strand:+ start:477 stop:851 length:375 start_codon:yes stop_codon:yes gene_type:complete